MTRDSQPTIWSGALLGALFSLPLLAVFYAAAQFAGTPFVPFDLFDWVARALPGPVITFGIDSIVAVLQVFGATDIDAAAKAAEQIFANGQVIALGALFGAGVFALLRARPTAAPTLLGAMLGAALGLLTALITLAVNRTAQTPVLVNIVWAALVFALFGAAVGAVYAVLTGRLGAQAPATASSSGSIEPINRRRFLVTVGGATAAITVAGAGLGSFFSRRMTEEAAAAQDPTLTWSAQNTLPNADDALAPAPGTRAELTSLADHYRIDINLRPPVVDEATWALNITGLVDNPAALTLAELRNNYEPLHQFVTLACISNPIAGDLIGTTRWTGVRMSDILALVQPQSNATAIKVTAADDFDEYVSLETIRSDDRVMLAYAWDGLPLEVEHGFPLRIYIPNRYGMKQPKWITGMEFVETLGEGYWVRRGWDAEALMRATAVIDTVAVDSVYESAGGQQMLPIGGIAHAGDRGVSRVEVRVDDGEWVEAQLRSPISETTWVIWRYDWPYSAGEHNFWVRCVEGDGTPQIESSAGARPSGATGLHALRRSV